MGEEKCFYHYDNIAENKSYNCGKKICRECTLESKGKNEENETSNVKQLYPSCNFNQYGGSKFLILGLIFYTLIIVITVPIGETLGIIIPTILFVIGSVVGYIIIGLKFKNERKEAKIILNKANEVRLRDLHKRKMQTLPEEIPGKVLTAVYCRFCGASLPLGENTCEYCGMTWVWQ